MGDDREHASEDGRAAPEQSAQNANGSRPGRSELDPLPPPAFPPGLGSHARPRRTIERRPAAGDGAAGTGVPDDAFISPDEPIVRSGSRIAAGAFISPEEPLPARGPDDADEGVVTGIGDDAHLGEQDRAVARYDDPHLAELVLRIGRLADALRDKGEAGLRTSGDMSRFEATLRAYCVGYLAAQRDTNAR